jgi:hypothetical protein
MNRTRGTEILAREAYEIDTRLFGFDACGIAYATPAALHVFRLEEIGGYERADELASRDPSYVDGSRKDGRMYSISSLSVRAPAPGTRKFVVVTMTTSCCAGNA